MNKKMVILMCTVILSMCFVLGFYIFARIIEPSKPVEAISSAQPVSASSAAPSPSDASYHYIIGEYNGKVAVYKYGEMNPEEVFEVYIDSLPKNDQELLRRGIEIHNQAELLKLIEDYTS